MTNMKPLHVYCCLETKIIVFWLPCQSIDVLCLSLSILWTDRNRTEKQIDIYGKSLMFMSRDLLLHFVEGPRGKGCTVVNSQRLRNSSERYWNGLGISPVIEYFPSPLRSVPQSLVQAVRTERSGTLLDGNTTWTLQWEAINSQQITRWQHISRLKASSFCSW